MLSNNEMKVLEIIKEKPFITQNDIGIELGLSRSTVATIISTLTAKNEILGRAYIIKEDTSGIFCIGGMNVDRKYNLIGDLIHGTSNPAHSEVYVGGVVRNIAENLGRLGHTSHLLSMGGHDQDFEFIKSESQNFVNFQFVKQMEGYNTGSYSAVLNKAGEMQLALAVMEVYDKMDLEWISSFQSVLNDAKLIVMDLNIPYETAEFVIEFCRTKEIDLVIVPVSSPKMNHLPRDLRGVSWVIVNQDESEYFFNKFVKSDADFETLVEDWLSLGLSQVVITRGKDYTIYGNKNGERLRFSPPLTENVVDVTGAGDSYSAGIIHGHILGLDPKSCIEYAATNAYFTIQSNDTVRRDLNKEKFETQRINLKEKGLLKWR